MDNSLMEALQADRRRAVENVREAAGRIWERPLHRYFTDHTVDHSERVIALLEGLTAGMMASEQRLSGSEIFVLLAAAHLHDIGMQNERFAGGDLDEIRAQHNEQTAEMIYAVFEDPAHAFRIPLANDPGIVEAVALVARGHRRVDLEDAEYDAMVHGGERIRLRLLAALLRFADELDIDYRRVDLEQIKLLNLPLESQLHWWRCQYVSGVSIVDEYIRIQYRLPRERLDYEDLIVPLVEDVIRAQHRDLEAVFRANGVKVALGRSNIRMMRLVQPLPPEVEALARRRLAGDEELVPAIPEAQREGERETDQAADGEAEGSNWNTAAVRDLLTAAFSDGELTTLCFDYFHPVYENFGSGMGKGDKIQRLIEYCVRQGQIEELLARVRERNPAQYRRFEKRLQR